MKCPLLFFALIAPVFADSQVVPLKFDDVVARKIGSSPVSSLRQKAAEFLKAGNSEGWFMTPSEYLQKTTAH